MFKKSDKIISGLKIHKLTVIEEAEPKMCETEKKCNSFYRMVKCSCDCGGVIITYWRNFITGKVKGCGCLIKNNGRKTHGLTKHPLFWVWKSILQRCYNKKDMAYKNYGGRGVYVCDEWKSSFQNFYDWAISNGWEKGLQLDKDIKGGLLYSPKTCCIITRQKNMQYRRDVIRVNVNGVQMSIRDICEISKASTACIRQRIQKYNMIGDELLKKSKSETWSSRRRKIK